MNHLKSRKWWEAAGTRAIRTFAQAFIAVVPSTAVTIGEVSWVTAFSTAGVAAVISLFTSLSGLPEVEE